MSYITARSNQGKDISLGTPKLAQHYAKWSDYRQFSELFSTSGAHHFTRSADEDFAAFSDHHDGENLPKSLRLYFDQPLGWPRDYYIAEVLDVLVDELTKMLSRPEDIVFTLFTRTTLLSDLGLTAADERAVESVAVGFGFPSSAASDAARNLRDLHSTLQRQSASHFLSVIASHPVTLNVRQPLLVLIHYVLAIPVDTTQVERAYSIFNHIRRWVPCPSACTCMHKRHETDPHPIAIIGKTTADRCSTIETTTMDNTRTTTDVALTIADVNRGNFAHNEIKDHHFKATTNTQNRWNRFVNSITFPPMIFHRSLQHISSSRLPMANHLRVTIFILLVLTPSSRSNSFGHDLHEQKNGHDLHENRSKSSSHEQVHHGAKRMDPLCITAISVGGAAVMPIVLKALAGIGTLLGSLFGRILTGFALDNGDVEPKDHLF
ncbi:hypothetical protein QR680_014297 [Steinernema hermaphroditum]|uniref:Uncharacterized protein n=1 Tax=Steinernema hermaphroditum TaxID=289476 RepID=A0AA39I8E7_9BILA|nr:hypothetical protein QR680_014297 [Steinernema hermaphroditum]